MKCKRIQRLLPLMVGGDLSSRKSVRARRHLKQCTACQAEYTLYRTSLERTKEWLSSERADWKEGDWRMMIEKAAQLKRSNRAPLAPWPFQKGWALGIMAAMAVLLAVFVFHPSLVKSTKQITAAAEMETIQPDILSLRMVSEETGLKINWFFRKDLKLEVMK